MLFIALARDVFYLLALEIFGALHPTFGYFLRACVVFCIEWRLYALVLDLIAFFGQRLSFALQRA